MLKIIDREAGPETVDCQVAVLRHLAEQDPALPVPRVFPTTLGEDTGQVIGLDGIQYTTCLIGFLPGRLLAAAPPPRTVLQNVGDTLARLDRALQGFFHPALGQRLAWDVRRLPELAEHVRYIESSAVRDDIETVVGSFRGRLAALGALRSQAIHGDCHGQNLLVDAARGAVSGILDFGDMIHAPRILEPAVTMSELLTEGLAPLAAVSAVLEAYALRQPLDGAEIEVLYDLIAARHAVTLLVHAWRGRHDPVGARVLDRSAVTAARTLRTLLAEGRASLTREWHGAAEHAERRLGGAGCIRRSCAPASIDGQGLGAFLREAAASGPRHGRLAVRRRRVTPTSTCTTTCRMSDMPIPRWCAAMQSQTALLATHTRYLHCRNSRVRGAVACNAAGAPRCLHIRELGERGERCGMAHGPVRDRPRGRLWSWSTPITASPTPWRP